MVAITEAGYLLPFYYLNIYSTLSYGKRMYYIQKMYFGWTEISLKGSASRSRIMGCSCSWLASEMHIRSATTLQPRATPLQSRCYSTPMQCVTNGSLINYQDNNFTDMQQ